jgi:hypothetical protein
LVEFLEEADVLVGQVVERDEPCVRRWRHLQQNFDATEANLAGNLKEDLRDSHYVNFVVAGRSRRPGRLDNTGDVQYRAVVRSLRSEVRRE